ncbi:hypothetical protein EC844_11650 [Acinetobacter calcoaceticus]|uniref:Uncharacterized protein n=1 Tax=Acinetobacter calcoaceticus TaxID=471 RepID=A0A4R1XLY1_ACICA|nr:hypothetical protein EC844_11650 [Acinetobacter calcoaceticus]
MKQLEEKSKAIAPEDDPNLKGTPVLGFKLQDSTFDSVKARLKNYQLGGESYAGGPVLENDGSGFDIEGLRSTQFAFDANNKLHYVFMNIDGTQDKQASYNRIVSYIKERGYKVVRSKEPFVGDRLTEFVSPAQETITVSAPHLDFTVYVEYVSPKFLQMRNATQQQSQQDKTNKESANF